MEQQLQLDEDPADMTDICQPTLPPRCNANALDLL